MANGFSALGSGIASAGSSIADAIRRRREEGDLDELLRSLLLTQKIASTGAVGPQERAQLGQLGIDVGTEVTNEDLVRSIIAKAAQENPALVSQNLGTVLAPLEQLGAERKATSQLEAFVPFLQKSGLPPEQIQSAIELGRQDPVAAASMFAEMFGTASKSFLGAQASAEGGLAGELGTRGQQVREQKFEDFKRKTVFEKDEYLRVSKELQRSAAALSGDGDGKKKLSESKITRLFNVNEKTVTGIKALDARLNENEKIRNEAMGILNEEGLGNDDIALNKKVFGTTVQQLGDIAGVASRLGEDGFKAAENLAFESGEYTGTQEDKQELKRILAGLRVLPSEDPGEDPGVLSPRAQSAYNTIIDSKASTAKLEAAKASAFKAAYGDETEPGFLSMPLNYFDSEADYQAYLAQVQATNAELQASGARVPSVRAVEISGAPPPSPSKIQKVVGKAAGAALNIGSTISEDVGGFLERTIKGKSQLESTLEKSEAVTPDSDTATQKLIDMATKQIQESTQSPNPIGTMDLVDKAIEEAGGRPLSKKERDLLLDLIRRKRLEVNKAGGQQ